MFTLEQIKAAHAKVRSGADFPAYIRGLKQLGLRRYEVSVADGHTVYEGEGAFKLHSPAVYKPLEIAATADGRQFREHLKAHQQGQTDYLGFCRHCAESGVSRWLVDLGRLSCTYYDSAGSTLLVEAIPA